MNSSRRRFLTAFHSRFAEHIGDIAQQMRYAVDEVPVYADRQTFEARNHTLMEHACSEGLANLDREKNLRRQQSPDPRFDGHAVAQGSLETALACLEINRHPQIAGDILDAVLDEQITDEREPMYGHFKWMAEWECADDPFAILYVVPNLAMLFDRAERLTPEMKDLLSAALQRSLGALRKMNVPCAYTALRVLYVWSLLLCGQRLGVNEAQDEARRAWREWFELTDEQGIIEYNSPCNLGIALYALEGLWEAIGAGTWRLEVELILDYFTFEVLIHTHPVTGSLAGPMSREPRGHLDGDGWTTLYLHRQFGTRRPGSWPVWAMNFFLRKYRSPRWLHEFCWRREIPYDIIEDHPFRAPHIAWPSRTRLRMEGPAAAGAMTGGLYPPLEVPYLMTYAPTTATRHKQRDWTLASGWRLDREAGGDAWREWALSVSSDQTLLDTFLLISFKPLVQEPHRVEFVFLAGRPEKINVTDDYRMGNRDQMVPWPRAYRIYSPGPAVTIWLYEPVDAASGEKQPHSIVSDLENRNEEYTISIAGKSSRHLVVPVVVVVRSERRKMPLDPPSVSTHYGGSGIVGRVSIPHTGMLMASLPPTERSEIVLHRSRYATLRPGFLKQLLQQEKRLFNVLTNFKFG